MAFSDMFKKTYTGQVWCNNCQTSQEIQIPKGTTLAQFIEGNTGKCGICGCNSLIANYKQIDEFRQQPENNPRVKLIMSKNSLRRPQGQPQRPQRPLPVVDYPRNRPPVQLKERAPIPPPRPSTKPQGYKPLPKNQEPDFSLKGPSQDFNPRKIFRSEPADFWTGEQNRTEEEGDEYENN